jgi:flavin-binding protein dodecin
VEPGLATAEARHQFWVVSTRGGERLHNKERSHMAKSKAAVAVYRVTEIIGTSTTSWEDAAKNAVETAAKSLRDLRVAEIGKLDMKVENGRVVAYRARVSLSFKYAI